MSFCPDFSDSDDGALSDDCDYENFKKQVKDINNSRFKEQASNQSEREDQKLKYLFSALSSGNLQTVVEFIDNGLDVNVDVQDKWTPLLLAVSFGNPDLVKELLKRGADANSHRDECTALMMACNCPKTTSSYENSLDIIKQLVDSGANVKAINRKRMTALMFAANNGNLQAVQYLLPLSDKNAEDNQRWTALFWAVNGNQPNIVKYLLEEQFEYTNPDIRNNTPVDIAKNNDFAEIIELFPKEEFDVISNIIDSHCCTYEETFMNLKSHRPKFFLEICKMLCGVRAEPVIKVLAEKDIGLFEFLSTSDEELKELGVQMPYQRYRILGGLYRFHKHPFHSKSLHSVPLKEVYSNEDMAIQLLSSIRQVIAMEASLAFIVKNYNDRILPKEELHLIAKNCKAIQDKVDICKGLLKRLRRKTELLDSRVKPADLITSKSKTYFLPWRKIVLSFSVLSLILVFKIIK